MNCNQYQRISNTAESIMGPAFPSPSSPSVSDLDSNKGLVTGSGSSLVRNSNEQFSNYNLHQDHISGCGMRRTVQPIMLPRLEG